MHPRRKLGVRQLQQPGDPAVAAESGDFGLCKAGAAIQNPAGSIELADPAGCQRGRNLASLPSNVFGQYQRVYDSYKQSINQLRGSMANLQNTRDLFAQRYPQVTDDATFQQLSTMVDQWQSQGRENVEDALYSGAAVLDTLDSTNQQFETMGQASQSATGALAATQAGNQINMLVGQEMMKLNAQTAAMNQAVLEEQARQFASDQANNVKLSKAHGSSAYDKSTVAPANIEFLK